MVELSSSAYPVLVLLLPTAHESRDRSDGDTTCKRSIEKKERKPNPARKVRWRHQQIAQAIIIVLLLVLLIIIRSWRSSLASCPHGALLCHAYGQKWVH